MAAKKKSGRLYIRMGPELHARLAKTAKALGIDINGLLNLIVRTHLATYELMAIQARDPKGQADMRQRLNALSKITFTVTEMEDGRVIADMGRTTFDLTSLGMGSEDEQPFPRSHDEQGTGEDSLPPEGSAP